MVSESNPLIKAKRRAGRVKRYIKRKVYERNIGKQYKAWLVEAETVEAGTADFPFVISILVPVYNPPIDFLDECLRSVLKQSASNWQLIVVNDGSTKPEIAPWLEQFASEHAGDPRIKVSTKPNGGISSALNSALAEATGEYMGMLDHDDALDPRCIETFSKVVDASGYPDAVYSDEDKINPRGEHFELYCKPDFSPELLLTQMYLCHFTIFKRELVTNVGGLRTEMDGGQDFDLALRLLPNLKNVNHIPQPLYHWRAWSESTALTIDAKPWAQDAAARAQTSHIERTFGGGTVAPSKIQGLNEVHPKIMTTPKVSVIIPTIGTMNDKGNARFIDDCVASLRKNETQTPFEIIVVTTGTIPPVNALTDTDRTVVYDTGDFNFAEAINVGRANATGDYLLILNDDTTVAEADPITRMLEIGQIDEVGIVGAKLTYPDGRLQHVGMVMLPSGPTHCWIAKAGKEPGYFGSTLTPRNYSAITAAAMLTRTSVFDELGGFDTAFARDFNDVDYCFRARKAGYRVAWTPYAHFTHYEGASIVRKKADPSESALFHERWDADYRVDPYYSPALNQNLLRIYEAL
jgi:GT2 family glycosyltransferase